MYYVHLQVLSKPVQFMCQFKDFLLWNTVYAITAGEMLDIYPYSVSEQWALKLF